MVLHVALIAMLAVAAPPARRTNTFELELNNGRAEIEWINGASFRFARMGAYERWRRPINKETVDVACPADADGYTCRARHLVVRIGRTGALRIESVDRKTVLPPEGDAGELFYALGTQRGEKLELNGLRIEMSRGLLISSAGYGEYRPGVCVYDLTVARRSVECRGSSDYYFYYGPTPKEILESHSMVVPGDAKVSWAVSPQPALRTWADMRENLYAIQHASMSGLTDQPFLAGGFQGEALERARQIAAVMPVVEAPFALQPELRTRLLPYLETYAWEGRDLGIPTVRPLAMQFPEDATAAARTDEFMIGDEMLVAPVLTENSVLKPYLPRGIWTELRTGEVYRGRQEIEIKAPPDWMPIFVRNGMIVPLEGKPLEMHYYPKLGAEFFLWEPDLGDISQFHAAPSTDLVRLESESFKDREFDWVIHNMPVCKRVSQGERAYRRVSSRARLVPGTWMSEKGGIRIRVRAHAGGDEIVHLEW